MEPTPTVNRSRFRSATDDPPSELDTPPPNMSDSPPPRPLWSSTSTTSRQLVSTSSTVKTVVTRTYPTSPLWACRTRPRGGLDQDRPASTVSQGGHVVEAADPAELLGLEARSPDESPVAIGLPHDPGDVRRLDGAAVEDAAAVGGIATGSVADPPADRRGHLLGVLGRRHLAGADRPDRFVGDHE